MTRRLPILLLCVAATAAGTARANAAWRPETPLALWKDAPAAAAPGARTNALGAAFCADTGLVPAFAKAPWMIKDAGLIWGIR